MGLAPPELTFESARNICTQCFMQHYWRVMPAWQSAGDGIESHLHVKLYVAGPDSDAQFGNLPEMRGLTGGKQKGWRVPRAEITQLQRKQNLVDICDSRTHCIAKLACAYMTLATANIQPPSSVTTIWHVHLRRLQKCLRAPIPYMAY